MIIITPVIIINESGEIIKCPFIDTDVSNAGHWLSDNIPAPMFNILQLDKMRKATEAEAYYMSIIIIYKMDYSIL